MASFTKQGEGHWLKIITEVEVASISTKKNLEVKSFKNLTAQWDTGSMVTCISERLVAELHLQKSGVTTISGIENKPHKANTYMVNIVFPNDVEFPYSQVVEAPMPFVDVLIGMDIISECDFHYSIEKGKSCIRIETNEY